LEQKLAGEPLTSIAVSGGRVGSQSGGELFVKPVAAPGPRVAQRRVEAVVRIKPLKEQIPEGDQRVKEAVVEAFGLECWQFAQGAVRQQLDKEAQQLGGREGRWGGGFFLAAGVFLDGIWYAYNIICIPCMIPFRL
jgi:hypothetical protein